MVAGSADDEWEEVLFSAKAKLFVHQKERAGRPFPSLPTQPPVPWPLLVPPLLRPTRIPPHGGSPAPLAGQQADEQAAVKWLDRGVGGVQARRAKEASVRPCPRDLHVTMLCASPARTARCAASRLAAPRPAPQTAACAVRAWCAWQGSGKRDARLVMRSDAGRIMLNANLYAKLKVRRTTPRCPEYAQQGIRNPPRRESCAHSVTIRPRLLVLQVQVKKKDVLCTLINTATEDKLPPAPGQQAPASEAPPSVPKLTLTCARPLHCVNALPSILAAGLTRLAVSSSCSAEAETLPPAQHVSHSKRGCRCPPGPSY